MLDKCNNLEQLWNYVDRLHDREFPKHTLRPIHGDGKTVRPTFMFVFINPTARNISTDRKWEGPRFPFIGTKQIWRIFSRAGLFSQELLQKIESSKEWSPELTNDVLSFLKRKGFYVTNIVKWAGHDATLPDKKKIMLFLPILEREIELVQPKYIVTFGTIPFEHLTKQKILLKEYYETTLKRGKLDYYGKKIGRFHAKIIPCYFPIGRGDPKKAVELLKLLNHVSVRT